MLFSAILEQVQQTFAELLVLFRKFESATALCLKLIILIVLFCIRINKIIDKFTLNAID